MQAHANQSSYVHTIGPRRLLRSDAPRWRLVTCFGRLQRSDWRPARHHAWPHQGRITSLASCVLNAAQIAFPFLNSFAIHEVGSFANSLILNIRVPAGKKTSRRRSDVLHGSDQQEALLMGGCRQYNMFILLSCNENRSQPTIEFSRVCVE